MNMALQQQALKTALLARFVAFRCSKHHFKDILGLLFVGLHPQQTLQTQLCHGTQV